jgi:hypothetical protein
MIPKPKKATRIFAPVVSPEETCFVGKALAAPASRRLSRGHLALAGADETPTRQPPGRRRYTELAQNSSQEGLELTLLIAVKQLGEKCLRMKPAFASHSVQREKMISSRSLRILIGGQWI